MTDRARVRLADRPGDLGEAVALHGRQYAAEYGLDPTFEGYVARGLGEWRTAPPAGPGRLRRFLVDASARGTGLGRSLQDTALAFARESAYGSVVLETFSEVEGAARMYRAAGFELVESWTGSLWGRDDLVRERYELAL